MINILALGTLRMKSFCKRKEVARNSSPLMLARL
jgi:hypothetical protein